MASPSLARALNHRAGFVDVGGARVAYTATGQGPALVFPPAMFARLGLEAQIDAKRSFYEVLGSNFTVVRYDRWGTGFSDRRRPLQTVTLDAEVDVVDAVADDLGLESFALFGNSYGGCVAAAYAARQPNRVSRLVLFGSYANGRAIAPPDVQKSILAVFRAHWGLGSRIYTRVVVPGHDRDLATHFFRFHRRTIDGDMAAAFVELSYRTDLRDQLASITAPTLVLHRRDDQLSRLALGRELGALIPGAHLEVLDGRGHEPWMGDADPVLGALGDFLGAALPLPPRSAPAPMPASAPTALSPREAEVLRLVAEGLSDAEIAERLYLSRHTVHRHIANIRQRLGQSSRAAAAAQAIRRSLI